MFYICKSKYFSINYCYRYSHKFNLIHKHLSLYMIESCFIKDHYGYVT